MTEVVKRIVRGHVSSCQRLGFGVTNPRQMTRR
jgi:hypothetical protein